MPVRSLQVGHDRPDPQPLPHRIEAQLGTGGMGEVDKLRDTRLDRTVAIKILPPRHSFNRLDPLCRAGGGATAAGEST